VLPNHWIAVPLSAFAQAHSRTCSEYTIVQMRLRLGNSVDMPLCLATRLAIQVLFTGGDWLAVFSLSQTNELDHDAISSWDEL
jgi:hypothetical protein